MIESLLSDEYKKRTITLCIVLFLRKELYFNVEPGTYNVQLVSGSGNFFVRGNHSVNEILGTSERFGYIKEYINMKVSAGDEIEVKGGEQ